MARTNTITGEVTREQVLDLLNTRRIAVVRAVEAIYDRQTADEQSSQSTSHSNGIGFNGTDAYILSSFAKQIFQWRQDVAAGVNRYSFPLSPAQFEIAQKKIRKYAGQLARIANDKLEAEAEQEARAERDAIMGVEITEDEITEDEITGDEFSPEDSITL